MQPKFYNATKKKRIPIDQSINKNLFLTNNYSEKTNNNK